MRAVGAGLAAALALAGCKHTSGSGETHLAADYAGAAGRSLVFEPVSAHVRTDTGAVDSGVGPADTGPADTGPADTGPADTGPADSGAADTGPADTGAADTGAPDIPRLTIDIGETDWTLTIASGPTVMAWTVTDGLVVDDSTLLPAKVKLGESGPGVDVTALGEYAVWYGTFPDVASTTVSAGALAGDWAFARDVGPIATQYAGDDWELVYYK